MAFVGGDTGREGKFPAETIAIWSGEEFSDPCVVMKTRSEVHENLPAKKKYWNPMYEQ